MNRGWITILMISLLLLGLLGCGGDVVIMEHSIQEKDGPVPIKLVVWSSRAYDTYRAIQDDFRYKHPHIELTIEMQENYGDYIAAKTASNDLPDLFFLTPYHEVQVYAKNGMLMDLSERAFTDNVFDLTRKSVSYNGKVYGYPMSIGFLGVIYNKKLFRDAGITGSPQTLNEFKEAVLKIKALGITPFASSFKDHWTLKHLFSTLQGSVVKEPSTWISSMDRGSGTFRSRDVGEIFDVLDMIRGNTNVNPLESDYDDSIQLMAMEKAAMIHNGNWAVADLFKINPNLEVGLFPLPVSDNPNDAILAVDTEIVIVLNHNTKYPKEALQVLDYISDNSDRTGWMHHYTKDVSTQPAMPFDQKPLLGGTYSTFEEAYQSNRIIPWMYQQYPLGLGEAAGEILQSYYAGEIEQNTVFDMLDQMWRDKVD